jgi:hypothetical protein
MIVAILSGDRARVCSSVSHFHLVWGKRSSWPMQMWASRMNEQACRVMTHSLGSLPPCPAFRIRGPAMLIFRG